MLRHLNILASGLSLSILVIALVLLMPAQSVSAQTVSPAATATNWSQFGFNAQNTRFNNKESILSQGNVSQLVQAWSTSLGYFLNDHDAPIEVNGYLYITNSSMGRYLYKLKASTGKIVWSVNTGDLTSLSVPAVSNGLVYLGTYTIKSGATFNAYNASNGALVWQTSTSSDIPYSAATIANGVVYFGGSLGQVYALNATTGALLWYANTGGDYNYTPVIANGIVYGDSYLGGVYAINPTGCTPTAPCPTLWTAVTSNYIYYNAEALEANGTVYVTCTDGKLYAFNASNGKQRWTAATGAEITAAPAYANGSVYVGSTDDQFYAFNAKTGVKVWSIAETSEFIAVPAVANGVVYDGNTNGNLYAYNAVTGATLLSEYTGPLTTPFSPTVVNGVVYVSTNITDSHSGINAYHLPA